MVQFRIQEQLETLSLLLDLTTCCLDFLNLVDIPKRRVAGTFFAIAIYFLSSSKLCIVVSSVTSKRRGMGPKPGSDMKMNAIRSGIVVLGALAFGYLSLQIGFKPYLEKAQNHNTLYQSDPSQEESLERDS